MLPSGLWFVWGTNLHEFITLGQAVDSLCAFGHYLRHEFRKQYATIDLNEAITLHRYVLEPGHPSNLHDLASCLVERFHGTAAVHDLEETIALEQKPIKHIMLY